MVTDLDKAGNVYIDFDTLDNFIGCVLTGIVADNSSLSYTIIVSIGIPGGDIVQFSIKTANTQILVRSHTSVYGWKNWRVLMQGQL